MKDFPPSPLNIHVVCPIGDSIFGRKSTSLSYDTVISRSGAVPFPLPPRRRVGQRHTSVFLHGIVRLELHSATQLARSLFCISHQSLCANESDCSHPGRAPPIGVFSRFPALSPPVLKHFADPAARDTPLIARSPLLGPAGKSCVLRHVCPKLTRMNGSTDFGSIAFLSRRGEIVNRRLLFFLRLPPLFATPMHVTPAVRPYGGGWMGFRSSLAFHPPPSLRRCGPRVHVTLVSHSHFASCFPRLVPTLSIVPRRTR